MAYLLTSEVNLQGRIADYGFHSTTYTYHIFSSAAGKTPAVYKGKLIQAMLTDVCVYRADLISEELIALNDLVNNRNNAQKRISSAMGEVYRLEKNEPDLKAHCGKLTTATYNIIKNDVRPYLSSESQGNLNKLLQENDDNKDGMTAGSMQKLEQYIQTVSELQSNDMQEDSVRLQQVMSKRDSAYNLANDLSKKLRDSVKETLSVIPV